MPRWSLRARILLTASGTLVALIGATLAYVSVQANAFVGERIAADLEASSRRIGEAEAARFDALDLAAETLASFPDLNALLHETDALTIREFLRDYLPGATSTDLLVALSPTGETLARTDAVAALEIPDARTRWIAPLLAGQRSHGFVVDESGIHQAAARLAEAGGSVFGVILAGTRIDDDAAQDLRAATGEEIVLLASDRVLGSTLTASVLPWRSGDEWRSSAEAAAAQPVVSIQGEDYAVRALPGADPTITCLILQSRDRALAPYRRIQMGLLALGVLAVAVGVAASAWLARSVTAPVARLVEGTKQIAAGNFDFALDAGSGDELGALASSFNTMTRGLRERADMQKFVSQSTMEMIRSAEHSAGERKRVTVFFSDIRGFSRFAEERPPEAAVTWLNQCLGLQADLVRKHHGDVDKFIGDAVFAVFAGEDMAFDAVRCAVEIQRQMETLDAPDGEILEVGIGLTTGEVLIGSIGSADRLDHTAVGNQVNLCSRLCSMAGPREILMADSTYGLVQDMVSAEPLEAIAVRGLAQPVNVHRMVIARSATRA